jgi:4'-phosphopantetheinyl transferase
MAPGFPTVERSRLDVAPERLRLLATRLARGERERAARFRFERDRRRFIAARARLRELLGARLGAAPEAIELACGESGKPVLAGRFAASGLQFSVSHSEDLALYAFASAPVGIDVEARRPLAEARAIAERFFAPRERRLDFFYAWTRKEAFVKALGGGLALPLEALDLCTAPRGWRLESFAPAPGFIAALALYG